MRVTLLQRFWEPDPYCGGSYKALFHCLKAGFRSKVRRGFFSIFFFLFKNSYTFISLFCLKESLNAKPLRSHAVSLDFSSVQFSSVTQSCPTLCNTMDCSTPGFPVHHQLLELAHTHVHQVGDAIQPFHPLSSPSLFAFNLSQHQGLF